jgi:hypothetical protein
MIRRLRFTARMAWLAFTGEPIRTWRKLDNGKYFCDGDCGRWKLHGVCTCGVCHYFKIEPDGRSKVERDTVSWAREGDSEQHMCGIPYRTHCPHGKHLNEADMCDKCYAELDAFLSEMNQVDRSFEGLQ